VSLPGQDKTSGLAACLMMLLILLAFTAHALFSPALSGQRLAAGFARFGDLQAAGVRESDLPLIAQGIAGYLRGEKEAPQVNLLRHGVMQPAFSQRELEHMPDVKRLTGWGQLLWRFGLGLAGLLAALALRAWVIRDPGFFPLMGKSLLAAFLLFMAFLSGLFIWALMDFTGLFYQLHLWLFPNDLWQLNPAEHLMIQLMPEAFFMDYALSALRRMAWLLLALPLGAGLWFLPSRRAK